LSVLTLGAARAAAIGKSHDGSLKQVPDCFPLVFVECGEEFVFGLADLGSEFGSCLYARGCGDDLALASVGGVLSTFHEASGNEVVKQVRHHGAVDAQPGREGELAWVVAADDGAEGVVATCSVGQAVEDGADGAEIGAGQDEQRRSHLVRGTDFPRR
jgi:hypothetical protein